MSVAVRLVTLLMLSACGADGAAAMASATNTGSSVVTIKPAAAGHVAGSAPSAQSGEPGEAGRPSAMALPRAGVGGGAVATAPRAGEGGATGQFGAANAAGAGGGGTAPTSGAGGQAAEGGSAGPAVMATPSAGCGKTLPRPEGGTVMQGDTIYTFPPAYDGKMPAPLLLALHAAGNPNTQLQTLTQGSRLEAELVRAFPKSAGSAWVYDTDASRVDQVIEVLLSEYCIDERRIFATGHSSGAQMVVQMLCHGETRFRAVAPVAASKYCAELSAVPVLYIQGQMDAQRGGGNGEDVARVFTAGNGCAESSSPVTSVARCMSSFDHKVVDPGCVSYEKCTVPTLWCSHNDNGYNNGNGRQHGWPCFASDAIAEFFLGQAIGGGSFW